MATDQSKRDLTHEKEESSDVASKQREKSADAQGSKEKKPHKRSNSPDSQKKTQAKQRLQEAVTPEAFQFIKAEEGKFN